MYPNVVFGQGVFGVLVQAFGRFQQQLIRLFVSDIRRSFANRRKDVTVGKKGIQHTEIAGINKQHTKAEKWARCLCNAGQSADISEKAVVILIEGIWLIGKGRDENIEITVAVVIANRGTHIRL